MKSTIQLGRGLTFPAAEFATEVVASLGMRGGGKRVDAVEYLRAELVRVKAQAFQQLGREVDDLSEKLAKMVQLGAGYKPAAVPLAPRPAPPIRAPLARQRRTASDVGVGNSGLRRMLVALAQRPNGLTNGQIGVRAGVSSKSGTFATYLARARSNGWVVDAGQIRRITDDGLAALGDFDPLPEGPALADYWIRELGGGASRMLAALVEVYPEALTSVELGERAGISHGSGTFATYLARLRSLELVIGRGEIRASEELAS